MKKMISLTIISLLILTVGIFNVELYGKAASKGSKYVICQRIVPPMMAKVKVSKKKLDNGLLITFQSKKADRIEMLKKVIAASIQEAAQLQTDEGHEGELLYTKEVLSTLTEESGLIKLQMTSDNPDMIKKIKKVHIPNAPYMSQHISGEIRDIEEN